MFITELNPLLAALPAWLPADILEDRAWITAPRSRWIPQVWVYVAGITYSSDIPITARPFQGAANGGGEAFVVQFALEDPFIAYSTYLGGCGTDGAKKILIDPDGNVAIAGYTSSADFPITQSAYEPLLGGPSAILIMSFFRFWI